MKDRETQPTIQQIVETDFDVKEIIWPIVTSENHNQQPNNGGIAAVSCGTLFFP